MAKIGLDIGHGSNTFPPSKGVTKNGKGYAEHDFNSKLGIAIKDLLEQQGHTVILGQQPNSKEVGLRTRTNLYNREGVDLVISVHANYNSNSKVEGRCAFYWHTSQKGKELAQLIINEIKALGYSTHGNGLHASKRGSWTNLHITRETKMPAVLVEHGFMGNDKDFELIFGSKQSEYIKDMAEANVRGIQKWLGESFKGEAKKPAPQKKEEPKKATQTSSGYTGNSIVDFLNLPENKYLGGSSLSNRKKLAEKHGIKNYSGTAQQNLDLLNKLRSGAKPVAKKTESKPTTKNVTNYKGTSIVDYLNLDGNKHLGGSSFENRKRLAEANGIKGYKGTSKQNRELLKKLQAGGGGSTAKRTVDINSIAEQIKRGIDNNGKRIPTGHENRRKHFNLTKDEYAKVRNRVNQIM